MENEPEQMQLDFKQELEDFKKQAAGVGRYKKLETGKLYDLEFTGKAVLKKNKYGKEQYEFELTEKNEEGQNRVLGVTKNSPFARDLITQFSDGNWTATVLRTGTTQTDTRYQVIKK